MKHKILSQSEDIKCSEQQIKAWEIIWHFIAAHSCTEVHCPLISSNRYEVYTTNIKTCQNQTISCDLQTKGPRAGCGDSVVL